MAYHTGEGKAFTKTTSSLMCPRSRGQMNRGDLFVSLATRKMKFVKSSSKLTKRQPYCFSMCSGIPSVCGLSVVYLVRRQMDSGNKPSTRCPSRCTLWHFPSARAALRCYPKPQAQQITCNYLCWRNKQQQQQKRSCQNYECAFR